MKKKVLCAVLWILTAALLLTIFMLSAEEAKESDETSGTVIELLLKVFVKDYASLSPEEQKDAVDALQAVVRTCAHVSEYAALGFLLYGAVRSSGFKRGRLALFSEIFCLLYAALDEIHQYFVPGRACQIGDVIADSCGALAGIVFLWLILLIVNRRKNND